MTEQEEEEEDGEEEQEEGKIKKKGATKRGIGEETKKKESHSGLKIIHVKIIRCFAVHILPV